MLLEADNTSLNCHDTQPHTGSMKGQGRKQIFERQSSDTSWSASDTEDDLEASKASHTSSTEDPLSRRTSGASSRRPPDHYLQLERTQAAKNNNYFSAMCFTDSEEEDQMDNTGYRSPAPSRLSITDYPPEYFHNNNDDEDNEYEDEEEEEELMEIQIETLTGTIFRVRVSSKETTAGLKNLLYRTEGLPPSQQHLLLGHTELDDERTLGELGVGEGSHLRLVISLKGGPINARRNLPPEDVLWREVTDIMDERREEIWETSGGRAVTLLVLRDGDSVNLYRVLEHEDGSFSPLNQSWGSSGPLERSLNSRAEEDEKTQLTMQQLRDKMEAVKLKNKKKKKPKSSGKKRASPVKQTNKVVAKPPPPPLSRSPALKNVKPRLIKEISQDIVTDVTNKPKTVNKPDGRRPKSGGTFKKTTRLVNTKLSRPSTQERSIELRNTSVSRTSVMTDEFSHAKPPRTIYFSGKKPLENIKPRRDSNRLGRVDEHMSSSRVSPRAGSKAPPKENPNYASYRQSLVKHGRNEAQYNIDASLPNVTVDKPLKTAVPRRNIPPVPFYIGSPPMKPRRDVDPLYSSHNNFDRLPLPRNFENRPKTSPEILERRPGSTPGRISSSDKVLLRNPDNHLMDLMNILNTSRARSMQTPPETMASSMASTASFNPSSFMSNNNNNVKSNGSFDNISNTLNQSIQRRPMTPLSSSFASMKFRRLSTPPSKPSSPNTSTLGSVSTLASTSNKEQTELLRELIKSQVASNKSSSRLSTPEQAKKTRRPVSGRGHIPASPARLPPVTPSRKKRVGGRRPRCAQCNKRIQISTTHSCRCGQQFCAQHRYAETHACTFDYKTEGRKILHLANPLVQPQKLPKI